MKHLINDNSIDIKTLEKNRISMAHKGFAKALNVYVYSPKSSDQNCYTNAHNPFVVDKPTRDLLKKAKLLSDNKIVGIKSASHKKLFDQKSNLLLLDKEYILFNRWMQTPLKLKIIIKKENDHYSIKTKINMYSYLLVERIQLKDLSLITTVR